MTRLLFSLGLLIAMNASVQAQAWTTIKGQVVLKDAPKAADINVTADKEHCSARGR